MQQEQTMQMHLDAAKVNARISRQVIRDGTFVIRTEPSRSLSQLDRVLRDIPGYKSAEPNTLGWIATSLLVNGHDGFDAVPGEWILHIDNIAGTRDEQIASAQQLLESRGADARVSSWLGSDGLFAIRTDASRPYEATYSAILSVPGFRLLEPNFKCIPNLNPNDPQIGQQYAHQKINSFGAWDHTQGFNDTVVAIIDSGIDYNHPDLAANIWSNPGEIANNGIDDDNNNYIDDTRGWNFDLSNKNPIDVLGHGTKVAGVVSAVGNNGVGISGVTWNSKLMALRFNGDVATHISAVNYIIGMRQRGINVQVANHSYATNFSQAFLDTIILSAIYGVIHVASAGNNGRNIDILPQYPASYNAANIITVASTDISDNLAQTSNFGPLSVDLAAPGVNVFTTIMGGSYGNDSGTSFAAPHVAGTASLLRSLYPNATYQEIRYALLGGIDPIIMPPGKSTLTNGRLNALGTLHRRDRDIVVTGADAGGGPHVRVFFANPYVNPIERFGFLAYGASFVGGVRVASGDVTGDGVADIATVPGPGGGPHVKVWDGNTGALIREFLAYDPALTTGLFVAVGDVSGDGVADIVTAPDAGGGPHVKAFSGTNGALLFDFLAYSAGMTLGVRIALGDTNLDARADIVVAPGPGGGPHVQVFSGANQSILHNFFAYDIGFTGGVYVAAGDVGPGSGTSDGRADIITTPGPGGVPLVKAFSGVNSTLLLSFYSAALSYTGGLRVASVDVDGNGNLKDEILIAQISGAYLVTAFDATTFSILENFSPYPGISAFVAGKRRRF